MRIATKVLMWACSDVGLMALGGLLVGAVFGLIANAGLLGIVVGAVVGAVLACLVGAVVDKAVDGAVYSAFKLPPPVVSRMKEHVAAAAMIAGGAVLLLGVLHVGMGAGQVLADHHLGTCGTWQPLTLEPPFQPLTNLGVPEGIAPVPQFFNDCDVARITYKGAVALQSFADVVPATLVGSPNAPKLFRVPGWTAGQAYYPTSEGSVPLPYAKAAKYHVLENGDVLFAPSEPTNVIALDGLTVYYERYTTPAPALKRSPSQLFADQIEWRKWCNRAHGLPYCPDDGSRR